MSVAADIRIVKRRVDDYLWRDQSVTLRALRSFLKDRILNFSSAAIVGGMARDFALRGRRHFKSDIDIVIDAPAERVAEMAKDLRAIPNRFGGFIYRGQRWKVDFWALETTWAAKEGHVSIQSIDDIRRSTFFDWDAILYSLNERLILTDEDYLDRLRARTIDINLLPNPSVQGNLVRAARRILFWDLHPGPLLTDFLCSHLTQGAFEEIRLTERRLYAASYLDRFADADHLLHTLLTRDGRHKFNTAFGKQMRFPGV